MRKGSRRVGRETGAALVELAVVLPLLVLIMIGATDFARAFYFAMVLNNAARAGAQYGAQSPTLSVDEPGMVAAAQASASADIGTITVVTPIDHPCGCASDSNAWISTQPCATVCPTGQHMVISVTVTTTANFSRISPFPIPGIPQTFAITRAATMRAQ